MSWPIFNLMLRNWITCLLLMLVLQMTAFGQWGYGEKAIFKWEDLDSVELPPMDQGVWSKISFTVTDAPPGLVATLEGPTGFPAPVQFDAEERDGVWRFHLANAYHYNDTFSLKGWALVLGTSASPLAQQIRLPLRLSGSRSLPYCRVGEVLVRIGSFSPEEDSLVYIYPQLEILYTEDHSGYWLRPHFTVTVETASEYGFRADGWNDCSGLSKRSDGFSVYRSPCKPQPMTLAWYRANRYLKVTFDPRVHCFVAAGSLELSYEPGTQLSFWWDTVEQRRVER